MKKIILLIIITTGFLYPQTKDPQEILDKVKNKFNTVKDYSVDTRINVDIEYIKVPDMTAKVYFKQPDKMKMDSKGFAMLPKQAFNFSPNNFLLKNYTSVYSGTEMLNGKTLAIIKVIPKSDSSDVVLTTLWIEQESSIVRKIESTSKKGGTFRIDLSYNSKTNYPLPSFIKFVFDMPDMGGGRKPGINMENSDVKKKDHPGQGIVKIEYSGYKVNQGLSDELFKEKKK